MAASKAQVPPVNLKERIAALQQRNVSPSQHPSTQPSNKSAPAFGAGGLRDRIAKFEEKGGVPVPRASFGMNVPQLAENAPARRRGELYANRVQGLGRPTGAPASRSGSPLPNVDDLAPRKRCISTSAAGLDNSSLAQNDGPVPPLPSNGPFSNPRRNTLTANLAGTRRVASSSDAVFGTHDTNFPSASHAALPPVYFESGEAEEPTVISSEPITSVATDDDPPSVLAVVEEPSEIPEASSLVLEAPPVQDSPVDSDVVTDHVDLSTSEVDVSVEEPAKETLDLKNDHQDRSPSITESLDVGCEEVVKEVQVEMTEAPPALEPECVAEQMSDTTASQDKSDEVPTSAIELVVSKPEVVEECADVVPPSIVSPTEVNPSTSILRMDLDTPTVTLTPTAPITLAKVEPVPEPACAPSTPTNQTIPIIVSPVNSPSEAEDKRSVSDMGSITIHVDDEAKPPKSNIASGGKRWKTVPKQTFTAVVHGKKTETSTSTPASNLVLPVTPQIARVRQTGKTIKVEPPVSPGYGELAMLLEEAALLERRLAEGDVDSDKTTQSGALAVEPQPPEATVHMETVPEEDMHNESVLTLTSREESIQDSVRTTEYTDAMSISTRSVSVPSIKEPVLHDDIPEEDEGPFSVPPTPPPKSPIPKYLSGIRRFASSSSSRRSSSHMPGAYPRDSISVSSEDSVATPPDNGFDLNGNGIAWPSVSPKKSSDPVSRSSSFADRFFNRSRTKSNMSHTDGDDISMSRSSTSSRFHTVSGTPDSSPSKRSTTRNLASASLTRPTSTISLASTTSNLGLFDKDIFDAFPSVPETIPPGPVAPQSLLSPDDCPTTVGRSSTMPVKSRKHSAQRFSMA